MTLNKEMLQGHFTKIITTRCQSAKEALNKAVFRSRWNDFSDVWALFDDGRAFHARAAATGKAQSPRVERRVEGAISVDVAADRRCRWTSMSAVFCTDSARYCGAVPLRQRCVKTHNRNWIQKAAIITLLTQWYKSTLVKVVLYLNQWELSAGLLRHDIQEKTTVNWIHDHVLTPTSNNTEKLTRATYKDSETLHDGFLTAPK